MTTKEIILSWLNHKTRLNKEFEFSSNDLQTQVPNFGLTYYSIPHTPDLYSREWRKLREVNDINFVSNVDGVLTIKLDKYLVKEFMKKGSKQKWYRIVKKTPFITK